MGTAFEPSFVLHVSIEVVENDVNLLTRVGGDNFVHEVEELDAPPLPLMGARTRLGPTCDDYGRYGGLKSAFEWATTSP